MRSECGAYGVSFIRREKIAAQSRYIYGRAERMPEKEDRRRKMIYTKATKKALELCFNAHKEQKDKSGMPYVFHPFHLAEQMTDEDTTVVALLHDVVEDTEYTLEDLRAIGFNERVISAIALMTHSPEVDYMDYVAEIKKNPIARAVKLADLRHNSDATRLEVMTEWDIKRAEKYKRAIALLEG